jgi:hypothetical protein
MAKTKVDVAAIFKYWEYWQSKYLFEVDSEQVQLYTHAQVLWPDRRVLHPHEIRDLETYIYVVQMLALRLWKYDIVHSALQSFKPRWYARPSDPSTGAEAYELLTLQIEAASYAEGYNYCTVQLQALTERYQRSRGQLHTQAIG